MSSVTVTKANDEVLVFEESIGHNIGNGAVQVMLRDGTQRIFNNFKEVFIDLDKDEKAAFLERIEKAEAAALEAIKQSEAAAIAAASKGDPAPVVKLNS